MNPLHRGESLSLWLDNIDIPRFGPLTRDVETDVCVVGAGIAGLTTAYLLMQEGKRVCVIESYEIGSGQTGRTTAQFSNVLGERYFNLEKLHGKKGAGLIAESHRAAIEKVFEIIRTEKIECDADYVNGYLFCGEKDQFGILEKEYEAVHRAGLNDVILNDQAPYLLFPRQAQLHPLKYLAGLAECLRQGGVQIYTQTYADEFKGGTNSYVRTREGHKIHAPQIVVATNSPVNDIFAIHTKQYAYRSYVMAFRIPEKELEKALYWDTTDPYHYVRLESSDVMIVGGEDHKTGQESHPETHYHDLENWARSKYPFAGEVIYKWSGQVMESMDHLGFLGHNPLDRDNVFVITGDSGNGMTHATIGAMLITDQIAGRRNPWEELYNPSRVLIRAIPTYLKENANVAAQYVDWLTPKVAANLSDVPYGQGEVFRQGTQMIAAYKDEGGYAHLVSAACPHLGGIVSWNSAEKSWDCPCHGSRFDCYGKVIEGPAISDLKVLQMDESNLHPEKIPLLETLTGNESASLA